MGLGTFFRNFKPKDKVFFQHFEDAANNVCVMSKDLVKVMATRPGAERTALLEKLVMMEKVNDDLTHIIFKDLARNFITPIDREDIHSLAGSLDDVADYILFAAKNLDMFHIEEPDEACKELARLVDVGTGIVKKAVYHLRHLNKPHLHQRFVIEVNTMENEADDVCDAAIKYLFEHEKDAIHVIKMRETYVMLETATDKCEDVANVIESIMLKYA